MTCVLLYRETHHNNSMFPGGKQSRRKVQFYAMAFVPDRFTYLMNMHACGKLKGHDDLVSRIRKTCDKHNVSVLKYVFNENHASDIRRNILRMSHDGMSDSVDN